MADDFVTGGAWKTISTHRCPYRWECPMSAMQRLYYASQKQVRFFQPRRLPHGFRMTGTIRIKTRYFTRKSRQNRFSLCVKWATRHVTLVASSLLLSYKSIQHLFHNNLAMKWLLSNYSPLLPACEWRSGGGCCQSAKWRMDIARHEGTRAHRRGALIVSL